jgi:hypothetical protein
MTRCLLSVHVALSLLLVFLLVTDSAAVEVYDNTATPTSDNLYVPNGFWPFSQYTPYEQMGDQVTLAGADRLVTTFEIVLSSTQPTVLDSVELRLYEIDDGLPADVSFWSGMLTNVVVDGPTMITFADMDILVPDEFVWVTSADSLTAGMATYDPPTIGSSERWFWDLDPDYGWLRLNFGDTAANFGARIHAVPEPGSLALFGMSMVIAIRRRRPR